MCVTNLAIGWLSRAFDITPESGDGPCVSPFVKRKISRGYAITNIMYWSPISNQDYPLTIAFPKAFERLGLRKLPLRLFLKDYVLLHLPSFSPVPLPDQSVEG